MDSDMTPDTRKLPRLRTWKSNPPEFARRLRFARLARGYTQRELSELTGYAMWRIEALEQGREPRLEHIKVLAVALDVPVEWLLLESERATRESVPPPVMG